MRTYTMHKNRPIAVPAKEPLSYIETKIPKAKSLFQLVVYMQRAGWKTVDKTYEGAHGKGWLMANHLNAALLEEYGPCDWRFRTLPKRGVGGQEPIAYNSIYCLCLPENRHSQTNTAFNR